MKEDVYYNEWEDDSDIMKTIPHWVEDDILARDNNKYKKNTGEWIWTIDFWLSQILLVWGQPFDQTKVHPYKLKLMG